MQVVSVEKVQNLVFPVVNSLITDTGATNGVKVALAEVLSGMSPFLGRDFTSTKLLPLSLTLLSEDSPEVKLAVVMGMSEYAAAIG